LGEEQERRPWRLEACAVRDPEETRTWEIVEVGVRHHTYNLNVKEDIGGEKIAGIYAPSVP